MGDVVAVDRTTLHVTIAHDDIPGLMPAMTMAFAARSASVLEGTAIGTRVRFEFVSDGGALVVTRLVALGAASGGRPGIHDHTPHHGGVVTMVGMRHLETVAARDGLVRVYLTDVWRKPLPLAGASGAVTLELADGRHEVSLVATPEALEAHGPPLPGRDVHAHVRVRQGDELLEAHYVLPLDAALVGAAGIPLAGCAPSTRAATGARQPRCTMRFPQPVTFVTTTPAADAALVAVVGAGVTAWRMPEGAFLRGLEPPPAITAPAAAAPHPDSVNAMAVSPDGLDVLVAIENRLLVYVIASGRLARELPPLRGAIRNVAWSPVGLLVTLFYDPAGHLLNADDGHEVRRLEVEREGAGVALSPDGRLAAVGSEMGPIAVFDLKAGGSPELLLEPQRAVTALEFSGGRLLAASGDGTVRVWDPGAATVTARGEAAIGLFRLAVAPGGRVVASAGLDRAIRLHDVESGVLLDTLAWHEAAVWGLAWAGPMLVSGDGAGELAVWDLSDRVPVR